MPTNYTGNPTASHSPASQPGPGVLPIFQLPNDGEPLNVASLRQNQETAADYLAWLMAPKAVSGNFADPSWYTQNARGQTRFLVDHMGYPSAPNIQRVTERWKGSDTLVGGGTATFSATDLSWTTLIVDSGGGQITVIDPDTAGTFATRNAEISVGSGATDYSRIYTKNYWGVFGPSQGIAFEFDVRTDTHVDELHFSALLGNVATNGAIGGTVGGIIGAGFVGMGFYKGNGDTNFQMISGDGTNLSTPVDSGIAVAVTTHYKVRLEYLGSAVADDSTSTVRGYINGTELPSAITANIPGAGASLDKFLASFSMARDSGSTARAVQLGQVDIFQNF